MKMLRLVFFVVMLAQLTACGGGGGGGGGALDDSSISDNSNMVTETCGDPATTTDPYLETSYDSCEASNADLIGTWMLIEKYAVDSTWERELQQRSLMQVSKNSDGSMNAEVCNQKAQRSFSFSEEDSSFIVLSEMALVDLELSIVNNQRMEGFHISDNEHIVLNSEATAIKISDGVSVGLFDTAYTFDGIAFNEAENLETSCFVQYEGIISLSNSDVVFDGEGLSFFVEIDNFGVVEELLVDAWYPKATGGDFELDLSFKKSKTEFDGEYFDNNSLDYSVNTNHEIDVSASIVDDHNPEKTATFNFQIDF